jgi:hypothetical protein
LGSSFSFGQASEQKDPFSRYLAGIKTGTQELALSRFATGCGVDTSKARPQFAVGPGSSFTPAKNLAKGLRDLDSDFYSTAEVWVNGNRILVESWANSDDVGSEVRYYKCFANRKLLKAEVIEWNVPAFHSPHVVAWGYSRRWERDANGRMQRTKAEFVDVMERPIPKPKLDEEGKKALQLTPPLGPISDLNLPASMLR